MAHLCRTTQDALHVASIPLHVTQNMLVCGPEYHNYQIPHVSHIIRKNAPCFCLCPQDLLSWDPTLRSHRIQPVCQHVSANHGAPRVADEQVEALVPQKAAGEERPAGGGREDAGFLRLTGANTASYMHDLTMEKHAVIVKYAVVVTCGTPLH